MNEKPQDPKHIGYCPKCHRGEIIPQFSMGLTTGWACSYKCGWILPANPERRARLLEMYARYNPRGQATA